MKNRPKIGLALGAGSAKGFAHLGVLKVLQRENIPIDLIAGSSIGSVFGALYAAKADWGILEKMCCTLQQKQLLDMTVPKMGLLRGERIESLIRLLTKNMGFEQLKIPLYVVAVDIQNCEEVIINSGNVADAVRASISIPGIFQPKYLEGKVLVDGAVLNRVPIDILKKNGAGLTIAVDLKYGGAENRPKAINNIFDVILSAWDIAEEKNSKASRQTADILIEPKVAHIGLADVHRAAECILAGEMAAQMAIPQIKQFMLTKP